MNETGRVLGIDPGHKGAIVYLSKGEPKIWLMPLIAAGKLKKHSEYDIVAMKGILRDETPIGKHVFIENVVRFKGQGPAQTAASARGLALWEGLLTMAEIPYTRVLARVWQKAMLVGVPGDDTKSRSIQRAHQLFPGVDLRRPGAKKDDHNIADALLIAEYGRWVMQAIPWAETTDG